jgi:hypothetical protein
MKEAHMLPDPLPTDPDELEAIYQEYVSREAIDPDEFNRLIEARLRAWGYDPQHIKPEQLLGLMEESMNRLLINLYGAAQSAPDEASQEQLGEIIEQAELLRNQINKAFSETPAPLDDLKRDDDL